MAKINVPDFLIDMYVSGMSLPEIHKTDIGSKVSISTLTEVQTKSLMNKNTFLKALRNPRTKFTS